MPASEIPAAIRELLQGIPVTITAPPDGTYSWRLPAFLRPPVYYALVPSETYSDLARREER